MGLFMSKPTAPTMPTVGGEVKDWASIIPQIYQMQSQYAPLLAQQQKDMLSQLYPTTSGLQENLAKQAVEGMGSDVPDWMRQQYQSNMNAQLGANAGSPIGADYMSRGLLQQKQDWKQYYQNMAYQLAGRQKLAEPSLDYMSAFTPGQVMQGTNQIYNTAAGIYGNQLQARTAQNKMMMDLLSSAAGAVGGGMMGMAGGGMMGMAGGGGMNMGGSMGANGIGWGIAG